MNAVHRPLSAWVAQLHADPSGLLALGSVNDGDDRADARLLAGFAEDWRRTAVQWGDRHVLGLVHPATSVAVVELDDFGAPIVVSTAAAALIDRAERDWPAVDGALALEFQALAEESLPLRYWLLERLDAEGAPPDTVFAVLPWELLDRAVAAVRAALDGGIGELVEIRHWLTPAVRGVTGPLEQLDEALRTRPDLFIVAASALLRNLTAVPVARIPRSSREQLRGLVIALGRIDVQLTHLADEADAALAGPAVGGPAEPPAAWFGAELVGVGYKGTSAPATPGAATLALTASAAALLGPGVRGTVSRTAGGLAVTLARLDPAAPAMTVSTGEPGAPVVPFARRGAALTATLPWDRPELPARLVFYLPDDPS
jgi:hypothetical protein